MENRVSTLPQLVMRAARQQPDNDFFVFPDRRETYREVQEAAGDVDRALQGLGVGEGDAVGILMPTAWTSHTR